MGFDNRNSLVIELNSAKESMDREYIQQVREALVSWDLDGKYELVWNDELDCLRKPESGLEAMGVCYVFAKFCVEQGFEDSIDRVMNNLSCQRENRKGGSRWDLYDNYKIKGTEEFFGGVVLNGNVALAEIWFDDSAVAYVKLN